MKITWTFYPKNNEGRSVSLTVIYVPELDVEALPAGGFLTPNNVAYVDWTTYRLFDNRDLQARQHAFGKLLRISESEPIRREDGSVLLLPQP